LVESEAERSAVVVESLAHRAHVVAGPAKTRRGLQVGIVRPLVGMHGARVGVNEGAALGYLHAAGPQLVIDGPLCLSGWGDAVVDHALAKIAADPLALVERHLVDGGDAATTVEKGARYVAADAQLGIRRVVLLGEGHSCPKHGVPRRVAHHRSRPG